MGNSIVGGLQKSAAEERQAKAQLEARMKAAALGASNIVNGVQTDANGVTTDALTRQLQQDSVNLGNAVGAEALTNIEKLNKVTPLRDTTRDVSGINALSAQSRLNIQNLEHQSTVNAQSRAETSMINAQRYADRTDAFRQTNPLYHAPVDIMNGIDVKGNLAWADYQRAEYEKSGIYAAELVYDAATSTRDDAGVKFTLGIELGKNEIKLHADSDEAYFQYKNKTMKTNVPNIKGGGQNFSHRTTWNYAEGLSDTTFIEYDLYSDTSPLASKITRLPIVTKYSLGTRTEFSSMHNQTNTTLSTQGAANIGFGMGFKGANITLNVEARTNTLETGKLFLRDQN